MDLEQLEALRRPQEARSLDRLHRGYSAARQGSCPVLQILVTTRSLTLIPNAATARADAILEGVGRMTTLGRAPSLAGVAGTAAFLASDRVGDITGTIVVVTRGLVPG